MSRSINDEHPMYVVISTFDLGYFTKSINDEHPMYVVISTFDLGYFTAPPPFSALIAPYYGLIVTSLYSQNPRNCALITVFELSMQVTNRHSQAKMV